MTDFLGSMMRLRNCDILNTFIRIVRENVTSEWKSYRCRNISRVYEVKLCMWRRNPTLGEKNTENKEVQIPIDMYADF